jgi:putative oxidoreductase
MAKKQEVALGLLRVIIGIVFLAHGYQKLFVWGIHGVAGTFGQMGIPLPITSAYLATFAELFGGLALLVGFGTRLAAIPVGFTMLVALLQVHLKGGFYLPTGFEYVLVLLAANVVLVIGGGGALALENTVFKERETGLSRMKIAA